MVTKLTRVLKAIAIPTCTNVSRPMSFPSFVAINRWQLLINRMTSASMEASTPSAAQ
jgi:hypothetical protein